MRLHSNILFCFMTLVLTYSMALPRHARGEAWNNHVAQLSGLTGRIANLEKEISHLLRAKKHAHGEKEAENLMRQLIAQYKELEKSSKDHQELWLHVRFKHPDRQNVAERKYPAHKLKSLSEMEREFGIDGRLDRLKTRVMATFPKPESTEAAGGETDHDGHGAQGGHGSGRRQPAASNHDSHAHGSNKHGTHKAHAPGSRVSKEGVHVDPTEIPGAVELKK